MNNSYYGSIAIPLEELKAEDRFKARNLWWRILFPKTARIKNKRSPLKSTLTMLLREKVQQARRDDYLRMIRTLMICLLLAVRSVIAQDKTAVLKDQSKRAIEKMESRPDTLVSRIGLIEDLREQQKAVKDNAERMIANIEGQIQALQIQTTDSLWVKKEIFQRGR